MVIAKRLRYVAYALVPCAVFLAVLEVVSYFAFSAVAERRARYDFLAFYRDEPPIFERRDVGGHQVLYSPYFPTRYYSDEQDDRGRVLSLEKDRSTLRVFAYGGSSTAGSPFGHWGSFPFQLQGMLERASAPGARVELVNFGTSGFDTTRATRLVERTLPQKPDVILIYAGHNEHCQMGRVLSGASEGLLRSWLEGSQQWSYTLRMARLLGEKPPEIPSAPFLEPICSRGLRVGERELPLFDATYRRNLEHVVALAGAVGADVVLVSQLANELVPPTPGKDERETSRRERAIAEARDAGRTAEARGLAAALIAREPTNAVASFELGVQALAEGDPARARALLQRAVDHDHFPQRFRSSYDRILRELAARHPHVHYVDAQSHARTLLDDGVIDGRLIVDVMHPNLTANTLIAEAVFQQYVARRFARDGRFAAAALASTDAWAALPEHRRYRKICLRYTASEDWKVCLDKLRADLAPKRDLATRRRGRRIWEFLFYAAGESRSPEQMAEALGIFRPPYRESPLPATTELHGSTAVP